MSLKLLELIQLTHIKLGHFKIHLATGYPNSPLTAYFDGRFKEWQEYQHRRNFQCDTVLSLVHLHDNKWLFVGVWKILGVIPNTDAGKTWYEYSTLEIDGLSHLAGRVEVSFARTFRASYLQGNRFAEKLIVSKIYEDRLSMVEFPGYSSVRVSYDQLHHIIKRDLVSWRSALKSVAGIYLITDTSCGKLYVGSASGSEGIWGRWMAYAKSGHGGNLDLMAVIRECGDLHVAAFQFSILEICDLMCTNEEVSKMESHWKDVFCSRKYGYNAN